MAAIMYAKIPVPAHNTSNNQTNLITTGSILKYSAIPPYYEDLII